ADRNRSHWSTSKTPSYTKSVSWQHHHGSGEFLTESGKALIDDLIAELVEFAKKQKSVTAETSHE
ncbi:hypothetical protein POW12_23690, partial [Enterobacter kobei]